MGIPAGVGVDACGLPPAGDQANAVVIGTFGAVGPGKPFAIRGPMNVAIWATINTALTTTKGSLAATVASGTGLAAGAGINSKNVPAGTTIGVLAGTNVTLALPTYTLYGSNFSKSSNQVVLPAGSNVAQLLGATVTLPAGVSNLTLAANTTVAAIVQADIAPTKDSAGQVGIIQLSAAPTLVPVIGTQMPLEFALGANAVQTTGADAAATFAGAGVAFNATVQVERSFDGGASYIVCNRGGDGTLAQYTAGPVSLTFGEPEKQVLYRLNCIVYVSGTINYRMSTTGAAAETLAVGTQI